MLKVKIFLIKLIKQNYFLFYFDMKTIFKVSSLFMIMLFLGCSGQKERSNVIIGIESDVATFNPAFTMTMTEGNISELIYLGLVGYNWNSAKGILEPYPLLAEKWDWSEDSSFVYVKINSNAKWSDGRDITSEDVVFTFDVYSDPDVQSKFFGTFENYELKNNQAIDIEKTFQIVSGKELKIYFKKGRPAVTFNFDMPLLPKHIFGKISRKDLIISDLNLSPVGSGPYVLDEWKKNQYIKLKLNKNSFLAEPKSVEELVFKIIPDYNNRIIQLQNNEIDFLEELKYEEVKKLKEEKNISTVTVKGRDYDYLGLNNIDPAKYEKGIIEGNVFFADSSTRKAIIYAINRDMIVEEYLGGYGKTAVTPIAPIFKSIIDTSLTVYPYSPKTAKDILAKAGWADLNNDGFIERKGKTFSFTLAIQGNNKLRSEIAAIIKDNLKQVGIDVNIKVYEQSVFVENMFMRKFDAFLSGWSVPIPVDLKPYWHSDLKNNMANTVGYRNKQADVLLDKMKTRLSTENLKQLFYEFQKMIYRESPAVFLFWSDKIVSYNNKIGNADFSPLGTIHYCWKWRLAN